MFEKAAFPIRNRQGIEPQIEVVQGWRTLTLGFHKIRNGKEWAATDLYSGTRICTGKTRQACLVWISQNKERIEEEFEKPTYIQKVVEFRDMLREELKAL